MLQLQNLLAELMDRFEFVEPLSGPKVVRGALFASSLALSGWGTEEQRLYLANCMSTQPMVKGEYEKGAQLPLVVRRAA